mmetsp:Transcript_27377/g.24258  ORF Transcript_27377/g.24258 Transcript_27377/m.24258 type:complete len:82 (+) Transcript_27377:1080-1325(+)
MKSQGLQTKGENRKNSKELLANSQTGFGTEYKMMQRRNSQNYDLKSNIILSQNKVGGHEKSYEDNTSEKLDIGVSYENTIF